ncbi:unnamed protein product [Schistosoma margrebowiei]|uniref:Uncharacterized protein n=1 Tax=Schistosoma margrebowiei TaxID=48269 RepID=A0A183MLD2_9TREM|nr:unnamed protein product [Schistosoma margrebowiei]
MKTSTSEGKHRIKWTGWMQLNDLDSINNLAFRPHTHEQMQMETTAASASAGLIMHKGKSKILKYNTENTNSLTLHGENLVEVECFTRLGSIIDEQGGSDADLKARIGKARAAFLKLKNI